MNKKIIILRHNDLDGFSAAYAAWKKFGDEAEYVPVGYETKPADISNREVYILDFCYEKKDIDELARNGNKITIIDHHKSKEAIIKSVHDHLYDISRSGAVLSWNYFHPNKPVPKILQYVQDYDLWQFKLLFAEEITARLEMSELDFNVWDKMAADFETEKGLEKYIEEGKAALKYKNYLIREISGNAENAVFEGYSALVVNSAELKSEIGNFLVKNNKADVGIIWHFQNGSISVSLRSSEERDDIDVSVLAEKYGGGGHKQAAGFGFDVKLPTPWQIIKGETAAKNEQ